MSEQAAPEPSPEQGGRWLTRDRDHGRDHAERAALAELLAGIRDRLLDTARLQPGHRVLDLGAGTGLLTHTAATQVSPSGTVVALDVSTAALAQIYGSAAVSGDACHLPIATGSIDRVVARSVLIYLHDLPGALHEIARVLTPAGLFCAFEPINAGRRHDATLDQLTTGERDAIDRLRSSSSTTAIPMLAFTIGRLKAAAANVGLTIDTIEDTVTDRLTTHQQVHAHLHRAPHPGAMNPVELITKHLGADAASRYVAAWHDALDRAPTRTGITFTTPVVYITARHETPTTAAS